MRYRDFIAIIKTMGFVFVRPGKGSHEIWSNNQYSVTVTHSEMNRMVARKELKKIGYKDWRGV